MRTAEEPRLTWIFPAGQDVGCVPTSSAAHFGRSQPPSFYRTGFLDEGWCLSYCSPLIQLISGSLY